MLKKKWLITSYLVLAIGLTACSGDNASEDKGNKESIQIEDQDKNDESKDDSTGSFNDGDLEKYKEIKLTASEAYSAFLEKKPGSKVSEIGLDYNHNRYSYKVEGSDAEKEYEIEIDAQNGEILRLEQEDQDEKEIKEITLEDVEKIDAIIAKVVEQEKSGFASMEWKLKIKNDIYTLEVEVEKSGNDVEYTYDLNTGELIEKDQ